MECLQLKIVSYQPTMVDNTLNIQMLSPTFKYISPALVI